MKRLIENHLKKLLRVEIILIFLILFGLFFRFYHLTVPLQGDEVIYGVSAMKFHRESYTAGKDYIQEHPPLGKWLVGIPSRFINADYESLKLLSKDLFVWAYIAYDALAKNFVALRTVEAIGGVISVFLIFLVSKQLFNFRAALWSAAIAALSFELIGYSRIIYIESPMIVFILLSLVLYINYLKSSNKKRVIYLGLFLVSLTATLLTRGIQPLFLLPIFAVSQFFSNKNIKESIYFLFFLAISYFIAYHVIFPFDIIGYGPGRYGQSSIFGLFSFKMFTVIGHLIFRNSLLFLAALIATVYTVFQLGKKINEKVHPVLSIYFVLSFLIFSSLSFPLPRHYIFMFIPLYIIGGYALNKISGNKVLSVIIILLAAINAAQLVQYSPNFLTYANFGLDAFQLLSSASSQDARKGLDATNIENPSRIMTNDMNTLIFFNGEKSPLTPALENTCNNKTIDLLDTDNLTVLYVKHSNNFNFMSDPYICPLLKAKLTQSTFKLLEI